MKGEKQELSEKEWVKIESILGRLKPEYFRVLALAFIIYFFCGFGTINNSMDWINDAIVISLGLLSFIAIFYSLIYQKEFRKIAIDVMHSKLERDKKSGKEKVEELKTMLESGEDFGTISEATEELQSFFESRGSYFKNMDVERALIWSTTFLLVSAISLYLLKIAPTDLVPYTGLNARSIFFACFLLGLYYTIKTFIIAVYIMVIGRCVK